MKRVSLRFIILSFFTFLFISNIAFGQCASGLSSGSCSGGNGAAGNGQNINSSETYWVSTTTTFGSGVNLNGGTLRICGNLTLSSINFNGGNIIIESGGSLTINGGGGLNLNGNTNITNYGTLTINRDITMQNANNILINAANATLNMSGFKLELNSTTSRFVNKGNATIGTLKIQSNNGGVCLGANSRVALTTLDNNGTNAVTLDGGGVGACMSISGNAQMNPALTNDSKLVICRGASSTTSGAGSFGSATVYTNCPSCVGVPLPVKWLSFMGVENKNGYQLTWQVQMSETAYFVVERSADAIHFEAISPQLEISTDFKGIETFTWLDTNPSFSDTYYRIKQADNQENYSFSKIIHIKKNELSEPLIKIYPNPSSRFLQIEAADLIKQYRVIDLLGKEYFKKEISAQSFQIDLKDLPNGNYFILLSNHQKTWQKLFINKIAY